MICMGRVDKGVPCMVEGCKNIAERSLSIGQVSMSSLKIDKGLTRIYLCHEHYKQWKKETKKDRTFERILYDR